MRYVCAIRAPLCDHVPSWLVRGALREPVVPHRYSRSTVFGLAAFAVASRRRAVVVQRCDTLPAHAPCMLATRIGTMRARARFYVAAALTTAINAVQILDGRDAQAIRAELGAEVASIQKRTASLLV